MPRCGGRGACGCSRDLESLTEFATNRTGLVVLHPPALAGTELTVRHSGGAVERTLFPGRISPHQPAFDIAGLSWSHDGLGVDVRFTGDVFEMEDQRNWTDASYKTYSRPLALPFPYPLAEGERVVQSIDVSVSGAPVPRRPTPSRASGGEGGPRCPRSRCRRLTAPSLAAGADPARTPPLVGGPRRARPRDAQLARSAAAGGGIRSPLDVRFVLAAGDPTASTRQLTSCAASWWRASRRSGHGRRPPRFGPRRDRALRHALTGVGVDALIAGGVRSHFTELNREHHRLPDGLDGLVVQQHTALPRLSTAQLVEALPMQRLVARQGVALAAGPPGTSARFAASPLQRRCDDAAADAPSATTSATVTARR